MTRQPPLHVVTASEGSPERRLDSWKDIAAYPNRTVRTAQRWERTDGLPVHRHEGHKRSSVYAFTAELDAWWKSQEGRLERNGTAAPASTFYRRAVASWLGAAARHRWLTAGVVVLAVVLPAGWWYVRSSKHSAIPFEARDWVLLADFDNQSGEPLHDRSLPTAFLISLQQSQHVNIFPRTRLDAVFRRMGKDPGTQIDEALGREVCLRENLRGLIIAGIGKFGGRYSLSARLVDPNTGVAVRVYARQADSQENLLDALGTIAEDIRRDLGESLASIRRTARPLPQVTTPSLEALSFYAEGRDQWSKGAYQAAVKLYESALQTDPAFAMAHKDLGAAFYSHIFNDPARGREHYEKALRYSERATSREFLLIQASYQRDQGHFNEANQLYKSYLAAYPDDAAARYSYGSLLMRNERASAAIEQFLDVIRVDPANSSALINLATSYRFLGDSERALPFYEKAFEAQPGLLDVFNIVHEYGFALAHTGDLSKAGEVFEKAAARPQIRATLLRSLALLAMYEGKYREARIVLRESILLSEAKKDFLRVARGRLVLAILLEGQGDRAGHLRELDRAAQVVESLKPPQDWLKMRIGAFYARAGAIERAGQILRDTRDRIDARNMQQSSSLHLLEGELALARGEVSKAVDVLSLAVQESKTPETLASLALALDRAGDPVKAAETYSKLIDQASAALGWEAQQSWIAANVRIAEIHLAQREAAKASAALDVVARLWKNADPDLPLARKISGLQARLR
jgi:tetratricopeptide (TPR) repeat protein